MPELLYFTDILGLKVYDLKGRRIGSVADAALVPLIDPIRVDRYLVGGGWAWLSVRHDQVGSISLDGLHLREELLTPYHEDEYMLRIARDLLDQQIIDVNGRKVVRVNDVTFEIAKDRERGNDVLEVLEVDIGVRSILRRILQGWMPRRWVRKLQAYIPPNSIRWEFCNIVEPDPQRRLRLNLDYQKLENLHPADLADIVEELSPEERSAVMETLDSEVAAEALSEVDPKMQVSILESLDADKAADIVEEMDPDEAADVMAELEEQTSEDILEEMDAEPKDDVRELLEFDEDTAGGMMTTEYVEIPASATVAEALDAIRKNEDLLEGLNTLFLTDAEGRLTGSVPLARLLAADAAAPASTLAGSTLVKVSVEEKKDRVTALFDKYNILTLPVLDADGKLAGVITADDVITVLRHP
ncbi:MAG TPA: CBS domain-containing protein [Bryobacteraceae bacterium]|nr:CBS domain-containing protein [Bryobacteraceae bacterium]